MAAKTKEPSMPLPHTLATTALLLRELLGEHWGEQPNIQPNTLPNRLAAPLEYWLITSKPYAAFVQANQRKIRKKIRTCRDDEERYNLYCELRTAYLLWQEPSFEVVYEPGAKAQGRSADFAVTFRTHTPFHVEVTRLRTPPLAQPRDVQEQGFIRRNTSRRLTDVVCEKFGQLAADAPNVLWVWGESQVLREMDVGQIMLDLKRRAEQRDADLFARHRFGKPADFIRYFQRLSAIVVQKLPKQAADASPICWLNKDARQPLPRKVANLLPMLMAADTSPPFEMP